jgi:hypothetical protein
MLVFIVANTGMSRVLACIARKLAGTARVLVRVAQ